MMKYVYQNRDLVKELVMWVINDTGVYQPTGSMGV